MRPLLALLLAGGILGGLQLYMQLRPQRRPVAADAEAAARGRFTLEITLTFAAGPDAFALETATAPALLVQLRGRDVLRHTAPLAAGEPLRVPNIAGLVTGKNEFYVQATPQDTAAPVARAVRLRLLRDESPLADATLWSEPGEIVQGTVIVDIPGWVEAAPAPAAAAAAARRPVRGSTVAETHRV